jgi:hypothetical protein
VPVASKFLFVVQEHGPVTMKDSSSNELIKHVPVGADNGNDPENEHDASSEGVDSFEIIVNRNAVELTATCHRSSILLL